MDTLKMVISALLRELKDQIKDRLSWRKSNYVVNRSQKLLDGI